jgi:hypothetical protein
VRVWLACACVFATKTMAVRIFRSGKIANFGGIILQLCTCFAWGATDSDKVSFYLLIHVKMTYLHEECNGIASFGCLSYGLLHLTTKIAIFRPVWTPEQASCSRIKYLI